MYLFFQFPFSISPYTKLILKNIKFANKHITREIDRIQPFIFYCLKLIRQILKLNSLNNLTSSRTLLVRLT